LPENYEEIEKSDRELIKKYSGELLEEPQTEIHKEEKLIEKYSSP